MAASDTTQDVLGRLERARTAYRAADERVAEHGQEQLETLADALRRTDRLLARYEDRATGTGDFEAFVTFQGKFTELVEGLPDELPGRDAFEAADERFDKRRLSESDFEAAREALADARGLAERVAEQREAREELSDARRAVTDRIDAIETEIGELERLQRFGDADLSAPTDQLREPIERYDEAATALFTAVRREVPARAVLDVIETTRQFPLVPFERPPTELVTYLAGADVGHQPIRTLIEYDDYSRSKLAHYVDDPGLFQARIAVHRTYLDRLSADPLLVGWPPPAPGTLRLRARELVSVTARLQDRLPDEADGTTEENVVRLARRLRRLPDETPYGRIREAARADAELTDDQRDRLRRGEVSRELTRLRDRRDRLEDALDDRVAV